MIHQKNLNFKNDYILWCGGFIPEFKNNSTCQNPTMCYVYKGLKPTYKKNLICSVENALEETKKGTT
jgi:hypothetical protein